MNHNPIERQNNFNLLRLIFALLVILSHSPEISDGNRNREILTQIFHTVSFGEFAVAGFFLLSGYLIVKSWSETPNIWHFLKNRVLRIYPGFIASTVICAFIVGPLGSDPIQYFSQFGIGGFLKGMALLQLPVIPPVFLGQPFPEVNGAMWTISLEFICYLSVLILGAIGVIHQKRIWLLITGAILYISILQKFGYDSPFLSPDFIHLSSFFYAGGCFYLYKNKIVFKMTTAVVATSLLLVCLFSWRGADFAIATVGGYLLFYLAFKKIPAIAGFDKLPDVSYGVYLYGWPVQKLFHWYFPLMSPWVLFTLSVIACLILGTMSWFAVEKPFMKLKVAAWPVQKPQAEGI